jgi:hypothetical protein
MVAPGVEVLWVTEVSLHSGCRSWYRESELRETSAEKADSRARTNRFRVVGDNRRLQ